MGKESIETISKRLDGKHSFLAESLLAPFTNQTNQVRGQMFSSHTGQCVQMREADLPLIFTGFENQIGKYSSGYRKSKGVWKIKKKFIKNDLNYIFIVQNIFNGEYDVIFRKEAEHLTEIYGFELNNDNIDSLNEEDVIQDDTVLYYDNNYDSDMNFKYGKNVRMTYLPFGGYTNEDGAVISESMAKGMSTPFIEKIRVRVNTNDILLNLYGDENNYKTFPSVGENVNEDGILLGYRRMSYDEIINKFQDKQLRKTMENDSLRFVNVRTEVVDIDIWSNNDIEKMKNEPYNNQILHEYANIMIYYEEVINYLKPIMEDFSIPVTTNLRNYYNKIADFKDPISEFEEDNRRFDNLVIEFTLRFNEPINVGSKICGRYGNKSIISKIVPDDEMPILTSIDGKDVREDTKVKLRADIVMNPFGVMNRLNPSQLVEQELNYIATIIRYRIEEMYSNQDRSDYLFKFLSFVDKGKENYNTYKNYYDSLDEEEKTKFLNNIIENGINIKEEPFFRNINSFDVYDIYNEFNVDLSPNNLSINPIAIGEMYFLRLKHEPSSKFSARSVDNLNMSGLPTKTRDNKNRSARINNNPIRLGKQLAA